MTEQQLWTPGRVAVLITVANGDLNKQPNNNILTIFHSAFITQLTIHTAVKVPAMLYWQTHISQFSTSLFYKLDTVEFYLESQEMPTSG